MEGNRPFPLLWFRQRLQYHVMKLDGWGCICALYALWSSRVFLSLLYLWDRGVITTEKALMMVSGLMRPCCFNWSLRTDVGYFEDVFRIIDIGICTMPLQFVGSKCSFSWALLTPTWNMNLMCWSWWNQSYHHMKFEMLSLSHMLFHILSPLDVFF